ncbi:MAG TPA: hypothetical protein ENG26_02725 [Gammaproteobacteria bacterium]|nr:hypothetical protein [Gammaproteobacteria bacterium]
MNHEHRCSNESFRSPEPKARLICGQAPSDYPELAEFLVETGSNSISLNSDTVLNTTRLRLEIEIMLGRTRK